MNLGETIFIAALLQEPVKANKSPKMLQNVAVCCRRKNKIPNKNQYVAIVANVAQIIVPLFAGTERAGRTMPGVYPLE